MTGQKLSKPSSFCRRQRTILKVANTELCGRRGNSIWYTTTFKTSRLSDKHICKMRTYSSHTALLWPPVTTLIQALREGECNRVAMTSATCLLGYEPRSLTVYRYFAAICSIRLHSWTSSTLKLCKHNRYPIRRCQIPNYIVTFTVAVVATYTLTLTLKQHVITAYGGVEVQLLSITWRVNCQLLAPLILSPGKKCFFGIEWTVRKWP